MIHVLEVRQNVVCLGFDGEPAEDRQRVVIDVDADAVGRFDTGRLACRHREFTTSNAVSHVSVVEPRPDTGRWKHVSVVLFSGKS